MMRFLSVFLTLIVFAGCSRESGTDIVVAGPKDLVGRKVAVVVGSMMGDMTDKVQPGILTEWFNDYNSGIEAVRLGKIAAMPLDHFYARRWAQQDPSAFAVTEPYHSIPWGFFFAKGSPMAAKVGTVLAKMKVSGDLDRILKRWSDAENPGALQLEKLDYRKDFTGKAGVFRFATPGDREPVSFMRTDGIVGFDIDIVRRIAYELDMTLEIVQISMGALVPAVQGGKADMGGGGIAITAERAQKVDFSECYYRVPTVFLIRRSSAKDAQKRAITKLSDLKGCVCADLLGTAFQEILAGYQDGIVYQTFNDYSSAVEAVRIGKVDAMPLDTAMARLWASKRPEDFRIAFSFGKNPYAYLFPKGSPLCARVNEVLAKLEKNGETRRLVSKWCDAKDLNAVRLDSLPSSKTGEGDVLRFATSADFEPGCFVREGEFAGFDIDIMQHIARELDMRLEVVQVTMSSLVPTVQYGKADMGGGCITVTAERAQKVDFSRVYMDEGFSVLVRNEEGSASGGASGVRACLKSFRDSFIRTFVTESRWKMMARGLGITLLITFLAAFFGTLLAFPVWLARTSKIVIVSACARAYIAILQGTPVLVLLMVLFYIVFGQVDIDGVWVAVIGFALNASAYMGEMLRSGVDSVPRGQTEAALALGYRPSRAFFRFVFPQAVRAILPVYRGELIGLLKSTSIVGYIAINDLTKASDLIRSRTYESFFPILTTAFIYFAVAWLLAKALERAGK